MLQEMVPYKHLHIVFSIYGIFLTPLDIVVGDVLVILDLRVDQSLFEAGVAREVVNKIQKLKKTAQLRPTDPVDVYYSSQDSSDSSLEKILQLQNQYIRDALGSPLTSKAEAQPNVEVICEEAYNVRGMSFVIYVARKQ